MTSAIDIDNLSFAYQDFLVLRNVSLRINENQFIGIIGPNGGGKTTLLKLILGFLQPTSGTIQLFGRPPAAMQSHIAYVPQSVRLDKQFPISALEVVLQGRLQQLPWYGWFRKEDKDAAISALEQVGMLSFQDKAFGTLSGGQAQRVLIARALVSNPTLLLLDEPTSSIDSKAQAEIYDLLRSLQGKMTILMVTHDLETVIALVESVICVQHSVMTLKPQEVCEHFAIGLYHTPLVKLNSKQERNPNTII